MAPDCTHNTMGLAFVATQEFLVTYCLTFVFFILFVVPFRVHFIDISWKLLCLHIFTDIFVKTFCVWNIIITLYWAARECGHFQAPMPKLQKDKHAHDQQLLQSVPPPKDKYLEEAQPRQYVRYESALDNTLIGIEHLNSVYLTHRILDPKILAKYLEAIEDDLEKTAPEFEPVFTNVYQYYGNSLISFTNIIDDLLLQLPILIKLKIQVPMSLFSIEMAPVPLDAETYLGEKREYTQIIPETELIALTENNYIPLMQAQISLCAKIGYMYYCEYTHLLKKCTEHTCMSAIYYDQGSDIKVKQCKTIVTFDTI